MMKRIGFLDSDFDTVSDFEIQISDLQLSWITGETLHLGGGVR